MFLEHAMQHFCLNSHNLCQQLHQTVFKQVMSSPLSSPPIYKLLQKILPKLNKDIFNVLGEMIIGVASDKPS